MNQTLKLAAWLEANAKHMEYQDEHVQMMRAAKELRTLDQEIKSNLDALQGAREMLAEMKKMLIEVADIDQEVTRNGKKVLLPALWR